MSSSLSLAFIEQRPVAAARALHALSVEDAAAYLDSIPTRFGARVLGCTSALPASRIILAMTPTTAASILRSLPYLDSVAILRLMQPDRRDALLTQCPRGLRKDFATSMSYPADTVGGQMSLDIVNLEPSHTIADGQDALRTATNVNADQLFVADANRLFLGSVPVCELFRHGAEVRLEEIMSVDLPALAARQSLSHATRLDAWRQWHSLPVLDRRRHLIGSLSLGQLHGGLGQTDRSEMNVTENGTSPASALLGAYADSARVLLGLLYDAGPAPQTGPATDQRPTP